METTFVVTEVKKKHEDGFSRVKLSGQTVINKELGLVSTQNVWTKSTKRPKKGTVITLIDPIIESIQMIKDDKPAFDDDGMAMMVNVLRGCAQ